MMILYESMFFISLNMAIRLCKYPFLEYHHGSILIYLWARELYDAKKTSF